MMFAPLDKGLDEISPAPRSRASQPELSKSRRPAPSASTASALDRAGIWLTPARFSLILLLLISLAFWEVILGVKTFFFQDYELFSLPNAHYWRESFWRGEIPLWNPLNNCGLPFLAQWNTMVLYPPGLFYLLLPLPWSLAIFTLLHLWLAGAGMSALAYHWTEHRLAAAVAGLAFAFSGVSLSTLTWPCNIAAFAWMPWIILMAERAWREGRVQWIKAGWAGAMQMLTGMAEIIVFTWGLAAILWLAQWVREKQIRAQMFWRYAGLIVFVAALAAAQLLPFLDLLSHSQRSSQYSNTIMSIPGWGWASLLAPLFRCHETLAGVFFQPGQSYFSSYYLGIGVLGFAGLAVARVRDYRVWLLAVALGLSFVLAMGDGGLVYGWVRKLLPHLGFMNFPAKFLFLVAVLAPLLAAFAIRHCCSDESASASKPLKWLGFIAAIFIVLVAVLAWVSFRQPFSGESARLTLRNGVTRLAFLALVLAGLFAIVRVKKRGQLLALQAALLGMLWADVATHVPRQNPTVEPSAFQLRLPPLMEMKSQLASTESRAMLSAEAHDSFCVSYISKPFDGCLGHRLGLFADCNLLDGIPKTDGFYALYLSHEQQLRLAFMRASNGPPAGLADFLGVSQMTAPGASLDWSARSSYMPLITAGQKPEYADEPSTLQALLSPAFNPRQTVFLPLEAQAIIKSNGASPSPSSPPDAKILNRSVTAQRITAEVEAAQPSLVVLAQSYYHNWKAYVDGQPVPLWRANYAFQAVEVPAGRHQVAVKYEDKAFYAGAMLSGLAWLGSGVGWFFGRKRQFCNSSEK